MDRKAIPTPERGLVMGVIAALLPNPARLFRLRSAVRGRHAVEVCRDWADVARLCAERPVHLAILDLYAGGHMSLEPLRRLKRNFPRLGTVAYVSATPDRVRDLFDAGRSGIDALILADVDDDPTTITAVLEQAEARGVAGQLRPALEHLRPVARDTVMLVVTRAHEHLTADDLGRRMALTRRVLSKHLEHACLPSPQRLITWGRLVVASHLLEDPDRSADSIAYALHFPSGSAFRNTCQRYLQATPSGIRSRGGAQWVIGRMLEDGAADAVNAA
ncbi:MAG: helix-turn-helix domain-containing protein [Gemmatimonadota bacterium]